MPSRAKKAIPSGSKSGERIPVVATKYNDLQTRRCASGWTIDILNFCTPMYLRLGFKDPAHTRRVEKDGFIDRCRVRQISTAIGP